MPFYLVPAGRRGRGSERRKTGQESGQGTGGGKDGKKDKGKRGKKKGGRGGIKNVHPTKQLDLTKKIKKNKKRPRRDGQRSSWQKFLILSALDGNLKLLEKAAKWDQFNVNLEGLKTLAKVAGCESLKPHYFAFRKSRKAKKNKPQSFIVSLDRTALHIALRKAASSNLDGYPKVVRALLQLGAKTTKKGKNGLTALQLQKKLFPHWPSLDSSKWRKPGYGVPHMRNKQEHKNGSEIECLEENQRRKWINQAGTEYNAIPYHYQHHMIPLHWHGPTFYHPHLGHFSHFRE